ncbi:MAG TPA: SPOR domain-containing protein [Deltaproteobacteria bacterium]|nr:SPOR domain-containing protein [Deltaproteobacteria bacterium]
MKRMLLVLILCLPTVSLWANYGLSNVVTKEIRRPEPVVEQVAPEVKKEEPREFRKTVHYPYTIHLSSWREYQAAVRQLQEQESDLTPLFITTIDLGSPGVWNRVDYGVFPSIKDAVFKLRALQAQGVTQKGAFVGGEVPFAIELGAFGASDEAEEKAEELRSRGVFPYIVKESEDYFRLLAGAYPDMTSASPAIEELKALGLNPILTKR